MDEYRAQFFSDVEGMPRAAVKRLTRTIERQLVETTINAPDWLVLYPGIPQMAKVGFSGKSSTLLGWLEIYFGRKNAPSILAILW